MHALVNSNRIQQSRAIRPAIAQQTLRVALMAALLMSACSEDQGPMLLVDVSLSGGSTLEKVRLKVSQSDKLVAEAEFTWPASASLLKTGIKLPKGTTGAVSVQVDGLSKGEVVASGSNNGTVGGKPIALTLTTTGGGSGSDGGAKVDGLVADGAPADVRPADAGAIDRASDVGEPIVEAGPDSVTPDLPTPEVVATPDAGLDVAQDSASDHSPDTVPSALVRSWSEASVALPAPDKKSPPVVAVAPATGNALVVHADKTMGVQAILYTAATNTWGSPVMVSNRPGVQEAKVAVDGNGRFMILWAQHFDSTPAVTRGVWASFSSDGVSWSATPILVYDGAAKSWDTDIRIAMNRSGQARVVWDHFVSPTDGSDHHKLVSVYLSGNTFSPATEVADCISDCVPRVAIDSSGQGLLLWQQPDPVHNEASVWAAPFTDQTVATVSLIENYEGATTAAIEVAMNDAGQGIAVWQQRNNMGGTYSLDLQARRYSVTSGWLAPDAVGRFSWAGQMSMVLDAAGTAYLAFSRPTAQRYQAMFAWQPVVGDWTTLPMETDNKAPYLTITDVEPQLALGPSGSLLMGWRKKLTDNEFAPHLRWRRDNVWDTETEVGVIPDLFSSVLSFGIADNGNAVAVWTYSHCAPNSNDYEKACPTAKTWEAMSPTSQTAWSTAYVSIYR
jgi:hypothetical protein